MCIDPNYIRRCRGLGIRVSLGHQPSQLKCQLYPLIFLLLLIFLLRSSVSIRPIASRPFGRHLHVTAQFGSNANIVSSLQTRYPSNLQTNQRTRREIATATVSANATENPFRRQRFVILCRFHGVFYLIQFLCIFTVFFPLSSIVHPKTMTPSFI